MDLINARNMEHIEIYAVRMFHFRALNQYLNLCNKTNMCTCINFVLSHIIYYQHVSIAFAIIILTIIAMFILITLVFLP